MTIKKRVAAAFAAAVVGGAAFVGLAATASADTTVTTLSSSGECVNQVTAAGHKVFPQQPCVRQGHKSNGHHRR